MLLRCHTCRLPLRESYGAVLTETAVSVLTCEGRGLVTDRALGHNVSAPFYIEAEAQRCSARPPRYRPLQRSFIPRQCFLMAWPTLRLAGIVRALSSWTVTIATLATRGLVDRCDMAG